MPFYCLYDEILACKRICYGEYTSDYRHDNTANIGVLGLLVDRIADKHGQGKYQNYGEQPDSHNTRYGIKYHLAADKEGDVLCHYHELWADEHKEHLPNNARP